MKQKNLLNCDGRRFSATIMGGHAMGKITVQNSEAYLCQDVYDGEICDDRKGYKYSWCVGNGSERDLDSFDVKDLELLNHTKEEIEAHKDWRVEDILHCPDCKDREVIFRSGKLVVCRTIDDDMATQNFTCDELYGHGWRLKLPEKEAEKEVAAELTLDEIKEKLNITGELKIIE
jgi:hypothetical protein